MQKYASIVAQTIRLATGKNHYGELTRKFMKAAGNVNTPKGKKYKTMWDIHWGFNFVFKTFEKPSDYLTHVAQFIVVFRLLSGWRTADLLGINRTDSLRKTEQGYYVRNWNTKTRKNSWSGFSFFPRIKHENYRVFCIPSRIDALLEVSKDFKLEQLEMDGKWVSPLLSQATPDKHTELYHALAGGTIKQKVRDFFLQPLVMMNAGGKSLWEQGFRPHSLRHANASALIALKVLIATDVAARGIDVEGLEFVLQHQLPDQMEYYTHRSGRTARAGKKGICLTLIESQERRKIQTLESELGLRFTEVR